MWVVVAQPRRLERLAEDGAHTFSRNELHKVGVDVTKIERRASSDAVHHLVIPVEEMKHVIASRQAQEHPETQSKKQSKADFTLAKDWMKLPREELGHIFSIVPVNQWVSPEIDGTIITVPAALLPQERQHALNKVLERNGYETIPFDDKNGWYGKWLEGKQQRHANPNNVAQQLIDQAPISEDAKKGLSVAYEKHLMETAHSNQADRFIQDALATPSRLAWYEYDYGIRTHGPHYMPDKTQAHFVALANSSPTVNLNDPLAQTPVVQAVLQAHAQTYAESKAYFKEAYGKDFAEPHYQFINDPHLKFSMQAQAPLNMVLVNLAHLSLADVASVLPHEYSHLFHGDMFSPAHHPNDLENFTMQAELRADIDAAHVQGSVLPRIKNLLEAEVRVGNLSAMPNEITPETVRHAAEELHRRNTYRNRSTPGYLRELGRAILSRRSLQE